MQFKAFNTSKSDFDALLIPSEKFLDFCTHCDNVFCKEFDNDNITRDNIGHLLKEAIHNLYAYKELRVFSEHIL